MARTATPPDAARTNADALEALLRSKSYMLAMSVFSQFSPLKLAEWAML